MYSSTRLILMGAAAASAVLWADILYGAGKAEGRTQSVQFAEWEETSESDPSPGPVEPDDSPSPTESDEA